MKTEKNNNKGLIILVVCLIVIILGLIGFIVYDKVISKDDVKNTNTKEVSYKAYNIGDEVTVKLNESEEAKFYVLKKSSEKEETVTLFAEKNIGESQFNNDFSDGNEYKGSLIEKKLNELTKSWKNVKEKRLITVDEIKDTGYTHEVTEYRCIDGDCPAQYTYINPHSFLLYPYEPNLEKFEDQEIYWTMTKSDSKEPWPDPSHYVYYVEYGGSLNLGIVGYKPGGEFNPDGKSSQSFGIRPVIVISKEYVK